MYKFVFGAANFETIQWHANFTNAVTTYELTLNHYIAVTGNRACAIVTISAPLWCMPWRGKLKT